MDLSVQSRAGVLSTGHRPGTPRHRVYVYNLAMSAPLPTSAVPADLQELIDEFLAVEGDAERLVEPLDDEQFNWSPAPGAWSIAQCIDHLNVTNQKYLDAISAAVERRAGRGSDPHRADRLVLDRAPVHRIARTTRQDEDADPQGDSSRRSPPQGGGLAGVRAAAHPVTPVCRGLGTGGPEPRRVPQPARARSGGCARAPACESSPHTIGGTCGRPHACAVRRASRAADSVASSRVASR